MPKGTEVLGDFSLEVRQKVLTQGAVEFIAKLHRAFNGSRQYLLAKRRERQEALNRGVLFNFLPETQWIRNAEWRVAAPPADLIRRKVEITGPASSTKMVINALNSGADVFMADAEDSESPTWKNIIKGQMNLYKAVRGTIYYRTKQKEYKLNQETATLVFRPRGWHLLEKNLLVDGQPVSASLFDFGLYFYNNARALLEKGSGPYFYLPKLESHLEARLWNIVFLIAQEELGIPRGSIRATVLIETLPAAFEMDEILYELKKHSSGLNCGRWDYIFSYIKKFQNSPKHILPDRSLVTMDKGFLAAYANLLVKTCHHRGAHAMGGMAAQIPIKDDFTANQIALANVRADKAREVKVGHDGTWVAHPGLVPIAREIFDLGVPGRHQLHVKRDDLIVTAENLMAPIAGEVTEEGVENNIRVGLQYLKSWLSGSGCVAINNLMEDAATAEICRAQLWQWNKHKVVMSNGKLVSQKIIEAMSEAEIGDPASMLFWQMIISDEFVDFLTLPAYDQLVEKREEAK